MLHNIMKQKKSDFAKTLKDDVYPLLQDIKKTVLDLHINLEKEKLYTKRLSIQNSILIGFIKSKDLLTEYSDFSKQYTDWDKRESNIKK